MSVDTLDAITLAQLRPVVRQFLLKSTWSDRQLADVDPRLLTILSDIGLIERIDGEFAHGWRLIRDDD